MSETIEEVTLSLTGDGHGRSRRLAIGVAVAAAVILVIAGVAVWGTRDGDDRTTTAATVPSLHHLR